MTIICYHRNLTLTCFLTHFRTQSLTPCHWVPNPLVLILRCWFSNLYGIPEHADSLLLRDTSSGEPYRLYNVDIFEYEPNSRLPMYGSIPLVVAAKPDVSIGIFWLNSADTYVDIHKSKSSTVHWMSKMDLDFIVIIEKSGYG